MLLAGYALALLATQLVHLEYRAVMHAAASLSVAGPSQALSAVGGVLRATVCHERECILL